MKANTSISIRPLADIRGPRPYECVLCSWGWDTKGQVLRYIHKTCPVHANVETLREHNPISNKIGGEQTV